PLFDPKLLARSRHCEPALRRAALMRTGIAFVLASLALLLHTNTCAFSVAGNVYGRSAPVASTAGSPNVESQNVPSNDRTAASPAFPLKASASNRYLVDQNNVPFLMVG